MSSSPPLVDLDRARAIHLVGVGGAGMSAIAEVLAAMGHRVSGSDLKDSPGLERLRSLGVRVEVGHHPDNLAEAELVAVSTAIADTNPEVATAHDRRLPVLRRSQILRAITATRRTIAVAGTHGKTTTSSMLALVMREGGMAPSFIIGGDLNEIGSGAVWDSGDWLIVEADESDGTFLELVREVALVTSVEPDHLEQYGDFEALQASFGRFLQGCSGLAVVCADDPVAADLGSRREAISYGTAEAARYRLVRLEMRGTESSFVVEREGEELGRIELPIPGVHNVRNAGAAVATAVELGCPFDAAQRALHRFAGVARRFQFRGVARDVTFVDDYAHLPSEVDAALAAAAAGDWERIVCVFQPHRYSRTASLWQGFAGSFGEADVLAVTDVYPAGEMPRPGVTGKLVAQAVLDASPWRRLAYLPRRGELTSWLREELRPGDLCLTLGAGDLTSLPDELMELME